MSDAEVFTVVGAIASVIGTIDGTKKVYDAATDAKGLPEAFREVAGRLPIVKTILESAMGHIAGRDENSRKAVKCVVDACGEKSKRLEKLFQKTIPGEDASSLERYYKAVKTLGKGNAVENLMKGMLEDVQRLACEHSMQIATKAEEDEVVQAITAVSEVGASVPDNVFHDPNISIDNSGPGIQNNAWGENIAQGNSRQFNSGGGPQNFGKDY
jgi:hypothetical protein